LKKIYKLGGIKMRYKKFLQKILDTVLKNELTKIFGAGSYVKITNMSYVRSKKSYLLNVTLFVVDVENCFEMYPDGLDVIIQRGWIGVGDKTPLIINSSIDVVL